MDEVGKKEIVQFEEDQINEIKLGKAAGIDTALYADPRYLAIQMRQIRLGLMEYLPVQVYADPEYDWFQMEEIRKGLRDKVDIQLFAQKDVPYEKMRQIRKGLKKGINLADYKALEADILEQFRLAREEQLDIAKYIVEGYGARQLYEIRLAMKAGLNMEPYLIKEYIGPSLAEIRKGLISGVDVAVYAKMEYSWRQMRELRLGMENRVDVQKYISPLYSWQQMREIRTGLQQGLDVSGYGKLRYTAREMRKRRMALIGDICQEEQVLTKELIKAEDIEVEISTNSMEAYAKVLVRDKLVTRKRLLEILEQHGIKAGIVETAVETILKGEDNRKSILVARGQIPRKGADGWYECFFRTIINRRPKILKDGSADYQNVEWFETVKEGQKLAYYHNAEEGIDGYTISGKSIPAQRGTEKSVLVGKGFKMEADRKTYIATVTGMVMMTDTTLEVSRHMEVEDVTLATGNIYFDGSLHVKGNVESGVEVNVTEDLEIDGNVGAATIICGGSILLKKGMNSAGHGLIQAKKGIVSRFFEAVKVETKGDIQVNKSLNSQLYAGGMIISSSIIAGGVACAEKGIRVTNVGNNIGLHTALKIGFSEGLQLELNKIHNVICDAEQELRMLQNSYGDMLAKYPPEVRNGMELFLKLEKAIPTKQKQIEELKQIIDGHYTRIREAKVVIGGRAHDGTMVEINGRRWQAENQYNIVVRNNDGEIVVKDS